MLIRSLVFLAMASLSAQAFASENLPWKPFADMKCQDGFLKLAREKRWDSEVYRQHISSFNENVFRNHSHTIGEWIEVHLKAKASPEVVFVKDMTLTRFSFDKFCTVVTKAEELPWELEDIFGRKTAEDWDNESLKALVNAGKKGMIYFWSPKFVYSVYDLPRMEKLAKKFGYEFTAVADPRATKEEIEGALEVMRKKTHSKLDRDVASKKSFLRSTSMDLYMRSGFNHFPVTYIYNNKNIHPRWITGIMKDNGVKVMADTFAGELK